MTSSWEERLRKLQDKAWIGERPEVIKLNDVISAQAKSPDHKSWTDIQLNGKDVDPGFSQSPADLKPSAESVKAFVSLSSLLSRGKVIFFPVETALMRIADFDAITSARKPQYFKELEGLGAEIASALYLNASSALFADMIYSTDRQRSIKSAGVIAFCVERKSISGLEGPFLSSMAQMQRIGSDDIADQGYDLVKTHPPLNRLGGGHEAGLFFSPGERKLLGMNIEGFNRVFDMNRSDDSELRSAGIGRGRDIGEIVRGARREAPLSNYQTDLCKDHWIPAMSEITLGAVGGFAGGTAGGVGGAIAGFGMGAVTGGIIAGPVGAGVLGYLGAELGSVKGTESGAVAGTIYGAGLGKWLGDFLERNYCGGGAPEEEEDKGGAGTNGTTSPGTTDTGSTSNGGNGDSSSDDDPDEDEDSGDKNTESDDAGETGSDDADETDSADEGETKPDKNDGDSMPSSADGDGAGGNATDTPGMIGPRKNDSDPTDTEENDVVRIWSDTFPTALVRSAVILPSGGGDFDCDGAPALHETDMGLLVKWGLVAPLINFTPDREDRIDGSGNPTGVEVSPDLDVVNPVRPFASDRGIAG